MELLREALKSRVYAGMPSSLGDVIEILHVSAVSAGALMIFNFIFWARLFSLTWR